MMNEYVAYLEKLNIIEWQKWFSCYGVDKLHLKLYLLENKVIYFPFYWEGTTNPYGEIDITVHLGYSN